MRAVGANKIGCPNPLVTHRSVGSDGEFRSYTLGVLLERDELRAELDRCAVLREVRAQNVLVRVLAERATSVLQKRVNDQHQRRK